MEADTQNSGGKVKIRSKHVRNFLLFMKIINGLAEGKYIAQIARELGISKQRAWYYAKKAEQLKIAKRLYRSIFVSYEVSPEWEAIKRQYVKSLSQRERRVRIHAIAVKFPLLRDNQDAKFDREVKVKNWVKKLDHVSLPVRMTIEKTSQHIILHFHEFESDIAKFPEDILCILLQGILYAINHLSKKGILIDPLKPEIIRQHIANVLPEFDLELPSQKVVEIHLGRKARSFCPSKHEAKVWIDKSNGHVEIETNDLWYQEKLLFMPEEIFRISRELNQIKFYLSEIYKRLDKTREREIG